MTLVTYTSDKQREVVELMGFKGTPQQTALLFQLAEHYKLDPLTKEIALIPGKGPFIGVWGRLHIGHRSGDLDGFEADDEWNEDGFYKVRCIVWRKSMGRPAAKVIGRVAEREKKDWPFEIARARAVRAAFGYAFNIHDSFDSADDDWGPPPDERLQATVVDMATGEIIDTAAGPAKEVRQGEPAAAPKRRRTIKNSSSPTTGDAGAGAGTGEVHVESEGNPGAGQVQPPTGKAAESAPAPGTDPPTINVGGHSLAQKLAMAARDAGIEEDADRHGVIKAVTGGRYQRGTDIEQAGDQEAYERCLEAFQGLGDASLYMRYDPDGTIAGVYRTKKP